ncbi:ABC transporter ATP-binding protein [Mumia sp. zg.B53]|uniref:ABC transporter ATP-binding protein n=1 Tax=Mumia sp. zg.B53 TaxID=2855449 RepID=UPI001C6E3792|nr:ABC transporter ATP-binding protein [Mumia sp. zg.B53]MBW9215113.1 ABC transporter ATP-binding protein [Mumia sp. zg.B53]
MISVDRLTKTFGTVRAVDDLTFEVRPGAVTGFLGPNGAGKTTTLRMLLGLVAPTSGSATIDGRRYADLERPGRVVGAALEAASFHPGRTALDHLRVFAPSMGVSDARCRELLAMVGLADAADRRVGGFSLGMRQRLALGTTLLGDPPVLILDEPANGLDPGGIRWLRELLRFFAGEGRTVLVSSHVLSEVQQTVDDVVIIAQGRLVHASPLAELAAMAVRHVEVVSPDSEALRAVLDDRGWSYAPASREGVRGFDVSQVSAAEVGAAAFGAGVELHTLTQREVELEDVFLSLTGQDGTPTSTGAPAAAEVAA